MNLVVLCVKDRASDAFGNPMFLVAPGQGVRSFGDEINRAAADNQLYQHPDDFDLYELGNFDTDTGLFESHAPLILVRGKDLSHISQGVS
ncbi:MAG: nonstructural protein [Microvirus sp.]|nr:MAG: nonstructural protein [Microvirus sp.]